MIGPVDPSNSIPATRTATSPLGGPKPDAQTSGKAAAITSDFTTFLKMLTTQMQNQDPLNPIDSTDYAVQLATFSGVEQQVRTNELIGQLQAQFSLMGMAEFAGWIGQEARVSAPVAPRDGGVQLEFSTAAGADRAVLVVRDALGKTVARDPINPAAGNLIWMGQGADGLPLPPGSYSLTVESWRGDEMVGTNPVDHYARITEARNTTEGVKLVLQGGQEVAASSIRGLRGAP